MKNESKRWSVWKNRGTETWCPWLDVASSNLFGRTIADGAMASNSFTAAVLIVKMV